MQKKHGFKPLGAAEGPVKTAIFGENGARLHGLERMRKADAIDEHRGRYRQLGYQRSNRAYGYIRKA